MANLSKYLTRQNAVGAASVSVVAFLLAKKISKGGRKPVRQKPPPPEVEYVIGEKTSEVKVKAHVDRNFFRQLCRLLKIGVPGLFTAEAGFLFLVAACLGARTLCDIWMIRNATAIENAIVTMDKEKFKRFLFQFFTAMPMIAFVNNLLKWGLGELKIRLRTRITHYLYDQYLKGFTYYKMSNLDNRIANADQLLTTDVDKFCDMVTDFYSNMCKPLLDMAIYVYRLTTNLGGQVPSIMLGYFLFGGTLLTYLRRPAGRMTVQEQKLEGEYRYINSRLITHSEEIAFYGGNNREKLTVLASFQKLISHMRKFLEFRVLMGTLDNILGKYFGTVIGFLAVSMPFMNTQHHLLSSKSKEGRFMEYYTMGRMMVKMAESVGRMVLALRDLNRLAGLTSRVSQLSTVLDDINNGKYQRTMITDGLQFGNGKVVYQDRTIRFEKVPLITPNGDVLVKELNFEVKSGMNVLVCGPNGCGKSSLFRVLGELWPLFGGTLTKPNKSKLFYIPQRPYMCLGTLRDQVIYPHTKEEMKRRGKNDILLTKHLEQVQLSYLLQREGGWDSIADWIDILSGGEKQRIAMARLFYHSPQFAILDECTSAVSVDVEGSMYQYCREVGITLFTVSHRKSLWKHHDYYLLMDGRGSFDFKPIEPETEEFGS
ncbi:ATP-binding cassette sub-family D member 3 [Cimex lectularius]|uniref:ABC Transporter n=1 Tax=Cimex lectularius TaxID=79782 RepID=A0A8I6S6C5_CIMLE|nr:ATP-binding cassette sub-family D member 3 [Cimex lectularius]